jgi:hypothetical protein
MEILNKELLGMRARACVSKGGVWNAGTMSGDGCSRSRAEWTQYSLRMGFVPPKLVIPFGPAANMRTPEPRALREVILICPQAPCVNNLFQTPRANMIFQIISHNGKADGCAACHAHH